MDPFWTPFGPIPARYGPVLALFRANKGVYWYSTCPGPLKRGPKGVQKGLNMAISGVWGPDPGVWGPLGPLNDPFWTPFEALLRPNTLLITPRPSNRGYPKKTRFEPFGQKGSWTPTRPGPLQRPNTWRESLELAKGGPGGSPEDPFWAQKGPLKRPLNRSPKPAQGPNEDLPQITYVQRALLDRKGLKRGVQKGTFSDQKGVNLGSFWDPPRDPYWAKYAGNHVCPAGVGLKRGSKRGPLFDPFSAKGSN